MSWSSSQVSLVKEMIDLPFAVSVLDLSKKLQLPEVYTTAMLEDLVGSGVVERLSCKGYTVWKTKVNFANEEAHLAENEKKNFAHEEAQLTGNEKTNFVHLVGNESNNDVHLRVDQDSSDKKVVLEVVRKEPGLTNPDIRRRVHARRYMMAKKRINRALWALLAEGKLAHVTESNCIRWYTKS